MPAPVGGINDGSDVVRRPHRLAEHELTVAVHLYGVVRSDAVLPRELRGRRGAPVREVADERLAVLISDLEADTKVGPEDLVSHAQVLEEVAEATTVVPLDFGLVMPDETTVRRELLGARAEHTATLLHAFDGLVQITVSGRYDAESALREVVRRDPELEAMRGSGEAVSAGLEQLRAADSDLLVQRLAPHARAVAFHDAPDANSVTGLALLVERTSRVALDQAVTELREELATRLQVRCVGPEPPYAFLDSVETEERTWG